MSLETCTASEREARDRIARRLTAPQRELLLRIGRFQVRQGGKSWRALHTLVDYGLVVRYVDTEFAWVPTIRGSGVIRRLTEGRPL